MKCDGGRGKGQKGRRGREGGRGEWEGKPGERGDEEIKHVNDTWIRQTVSKLHTPRINYRAFNGSYMYFLY